MAKSTRETVNITGTTLNRLLRSAMSGHEGVHEVADTVVRSLAIRLRGHSAEWILRVRIHRGSDKPPSLTVRPIGPISQLRNIEAVRALAARGKEIARQGGDPAELFSAARSQAEASLDETEAVVQRRRGEIWTWQELRDNFLDDTKRLKRADTYRSYRSVLNQPDFAPLMDKLISRIDAADLIMVRDTMIKRGTSTQAAAAVRTAKAAFSWATEQPGSGLRTNLVTGVKTTSRRASIQPQQALLDSGAEETEGRALTDEELGKLPWAFGDYPNPGARLACMLLMTTLQRRLTVVSALKTAFAVDPQTQFLRWRAHPGMMKGGRNHDLPILPLAQQAYEAALAIAPSSSPWLFPQQRKRFAQDQGKGHMNGRTLNTLFYAAQAPGRSLERKKGRSLISPHDVRTTFTTFMKERHGCGEDDIALILHHSENRNKTVTSKHYDEAKLLMKKAEMLELWEKHLYAVMAEYEPT